MPKVGDVVADKYTIDQLIGLGGMGAVFAATHKFTGKRVALKWMLPELAQDADAVQRFMREAHAAGRINHPNVVDVYDVGQHQESYFLVMEYLQGEPLTSALARRDMTHNELLELLLPAMRGVSAAHRQGVVHRDLKPDNIFLAYEEDGAGREPKVLDFGISKLSNEGPINPRLTKTGAVVGTPYYMSPEQIRGSNQLDKRADIYAFGVILYEALTGQVPFHADTYGALVLEIATGTPKTPRELVPALPSDLSRIVLRAMSRDAAQRYPDMESLIRALEPFSVPSNTTTTKRREPTGSHSVGVGLDATRVAEPVPPVPLVPTLPQLASTPFASEAPEVPRRFPANGGVLFVAAALLVVGGVWFFTREPEAAYEPVVMPAPLTPTSTVTTAAAVAPAMPAAPVAPSPPAEAIPTSTTGSSTAAADSETPLNMAPGDHKSAHDGGDTERGARYKAWKTRRDAKHANATQSETEARPVTPAAPSAPVRKARSGTLSPEEF